jgi:hypothetical protein
VVRPKWSFVQKRSFEEAVLAAFLCALPMFISQVVYSASSSMLASVAGGMFQWGMLVGLMTAVPYATLDHPRVENRRYWLRTALWYAGVFGLAGLPEWVFGGRSTVRLQKLASMSVCAPVGLWIGLVTGSRVREWLVVLKRVFDFVWSLGRPVGAFIFGYAVIVFAYGEVYAALWKLDKAGALSGVSPSPSIGEFLYFSLVTAATVGYGDIAPRSGWARLTASMEITMSLGWTIVVFAAIMSVFADQAKKGKPRTDGTQ